MSSKHLQPCPDKGPKNGLKQTLGLAQATIYGVGIILGAGIYALIGEAAGIAGNSMWISFIIAAVIALFTALSYAELTTLFPKAAAEFVYVKRTTGSKMSAFFIGYVTIITGIISAAAVAIGFASYCKLLLPINPAWIGVGIVLLLTLINLKGIEESAFLNTVFTLIEVSGLLFIIVVGWKYLGSVNLFHDINNQPLNSIKQVSPIFATTALIFFAYIGFEDVVNIAEETKNPKKVIPVALILSLLISTIIYILVAMVAVSVVSPAQLMQSTQNNIISEGPLALVATAALNNPTAGKLFTFVALFATANTILVLLIVSSRMMYGIAREKCLPAILGRVHQVNQTPVAAILLTSTLSILFVLNGSLSEVVKLTNVGVFLTFFAVNIALIIYRYKNRFNTNTNRNTFRSPVNYGWVPIMACLGSLFCLGMLLTQYWSPIKVIGHDIPLLIFAMLIFLTALPIYWYYN